ncbi:MAG: hypothetical protein HY883_06540 [Deltaproteobacteria bacterium]|nr:hypothetical protein [Deltaproteobacteria bacterium]
MTNAEQDIIRAFEERIEALGSIKAETARFLDECRKLDKERKEFVVNFKKDVSGLRDGIRSDIGEIKEEVAGMLGEFHKERQETAAAWSELVSIMRSKRSGEHKGHTKHAPAGLPRQVLSRGVKQGKARRAGAIS